MVSEFPGIKDILLDFLREQRMQIQARLKEAFPQAPEDCVSSVLACLVTSNGTKLPIPYKVTDDGYKLSKKAHPYLQQLPSEVLRFVFDKLCDSRLLRKEDGRFELAHDTLAKIIDRLQDDRQRKLHAIIGQIKAAYEGHSLTGEFLTYREVKAYEEYISPLYLPHDLMDFFYKSKAHREREEQQQLNSRRWFRRLKTLNIVIGGFFIFGVLVGLAYVRSTNKTYGQLYMAYTIDTISDRSNGIKLAKYIYNYVSDADARTQMSRKIRDLVLDQSVQGQLAIYSDTLKKKAFAPGEVEVSADGKYMVVRDSTCVLFRNGVRQDIGTYTYAYFLNNSDTLLMAKSSIRDSLRGGMMMYPDSITLYDCKRNIPYFSMILDDSTYLFNAGSIFSSNLYNPRDTYKVQYTASGHLLIPYWQVRQFRSFSWVLLLRNDGSRTRLQSYGTVGLSKNGRQFMALGFQDQMPVLRIFDESGRLQYKLPGQDNFADFTEKGSLLYYSITDGSSGSYLHRLDSGYQHHDSFPATEAYTCVYADGNERYAVCMGSNVVNVIDLATGQHSHVGEKLIGIDFRDGRFVTQTKASIRRQGAATSPDTLVLRRFPATAIDTFICNEGVESIAYDDASHCILVLGHGVPGSAFQFLYLLDSRLNVRGSFGLTPNDRFGFSADGARIWYARDNIVSTFQNNARLVDLTNPDLAKQWIDTTERFRTSSGELKNLKKRYDLRFPGELLSIF